MEGLFGRIVAVVLHALVGAGIGGLIGALAGAPVGLSVTGAICGASFSAFIDRWRGSRVLLWLRTAPDAPAPRDSGFWGELAYRMERVLSQREQRTQAERDKLRQFLTAIEASPNGVLLLDAHGQIEWCNRVAADHFGLDPVRDVQQRITNLVRVPEFVSYLQQGAFDRPVVYTNPRARERCRCWSGPTATARDWCCRRTSPSGCGPRRCVGTSWPMSRTRSARR